jgi:ATP-binding cassette subfamily C protein
MNFLVFAGTIYMMLVYDSVLPSRSIPTLIGLFMLVVLIYLFQMLFEAIRSEAIRSEAIRSEAIRSEAIRSEAMLRDNAQGRHSHSQHQAHKC